MTTHQLLEKYAAMKDTSADPDYEPSDEPQSEEISTEAETSSEDDETESQRKHNGEKKLCPNVSYFIL